MQAFGLVPTNLQFVHVYSSVVNVYKSIDTCCSVGVKPAF